MVRRHVRERSCKHYQQLDGSEGSFSSSAAEPGALTGGSWEAGTQHGVQCTEAKGQSDKGLLCGVTQKARQFNLPVVKGEEGGRGTGKVGRERGTVKDEG